MDADAWGPPIDDEADGHGRVGRDRVVGATGATGAIAGWADTALLALLALLVAAPGLATPAALVFDERYYLTDALDLLDVGVARAFQAHPPLGTWLLALGPWLVEGPVGWRVAPLAAGIATVAVLHRTARRLLPPGRTGRALAAAAGVLLVSDGSWLVFSRTGMLDGPLTLLVVAAVGAAVAAVDADDPGRRRRLVLLAGALVGAATAVKWSGALAGFVVVVVLLVLADPGGVRDRRPWRDAVVAGLVAVLLYAVTWVPFAVRRAEVPVTGCPTIAEPCATSGGLGGVLDAHRSMVRFHTSLDAAGVGATAPAVWPLMQTSYGFFRPDCNTAPTPGVSPFVSEDECVGPAPPVAARIVYVGNPVLWIGFLAAAPLLAAGARRRDRASVVALAGWALLWLPWLAATRTAFIWSMAPTVPFMALGLACSTAVATRTRLVRAVAAGGVGALAGATLVLVSPTAGVAGAVVGWSLTPALLPAGRGRGGDVARPSTPTPGRTAGPLVAACAIVAAAAVVAALLRPVWTVTSTDEAVATVSGPVVTGGRVLDGTAGAYADSAAGGTSRS